MAIVWVVEGAIELVTKSIVMFEPLSAAVKDGWLETTLTLYPVPVAVPAGIVPVIVPEFNVARVPRVTGELNEPLASES